MLRGVLSLRDVEIYARGYGLHGYESRVGLCFRIQLDFYVSYSSLRKEDQRGILDYEGVYRWLKEQIDTFSCTWIEELSWHLGKGLLDLYPQVDRLFIEVEKTIEQELGKGFKTAFRLELPQ
ncbi:MAG: hypothetical protein OXB93_02785 [Cytophagales bacterium]|nr:hypothetical protein [Cytophagales bacterium]